MKLYQRWKQTSLPNKLIVWTGAMVAFGTLFYACAAAVQVWIMYTGSDQSSKQADKLIGHIKEISDAMKETATQTKSVLDATIENNRLDQRAWVGMAGVIIANIKAGSNGSVGLALVNSGKTPAIDFKGEVAARYFSKNSKFSPIYPDRKTYTGPEGRTVLSPNIRIESVTKFPRDRPFTTEEIESLKRGDDILYIFGRTFYKDIFKLPHSTKICAWVGQDLTSGHSCDTYNEAD